MKKTLFLFFVLILLFLSTTCLVFGQDIEKKVHLSFSTGRQQENFNWSIAGNNNGANPNILSELKWKNVSGEDYSAAFRWNIWHKFVFMADYNRVAVSSGSVSDMDYSGDNRTEPVYAENFSDDKGYTASWSTGAGYIIFNNTLFSLAPYFGYGINKQSLYLVDLTGQFPRLNSSYTADWKGVFLKVSSSVKIFKALNFSADVTYNQVNYTADGNWNLINEFQHPVSYSHQAKGYGINTDTRLVYKITKHLAINVGYQYFNWQTGNGNDLLYLSSGEVDKTRLNGVFRNGFEFMGGVDVFF
jgi:hypothetical protein